MSDEEIALVVVVLWYRDFRGHVWALRETKEWSEILVIDLPEELADLDARIADYFVDRVHPSPAGHREIARVLDTRLREWKPWESGHGPPP